MEHRHIQNDWNDRQFIAHVSCSIARIGEFLNRFGTHSTVKTGADICVAADQCNWAVVILPVYSYCDRHVGARQACQAE